MEQKRLSKPHAATGGRVFMRSPRGHGGLGNKQHLSPFHVIQTDTCFYRNVLTLI